MDLPYRLPSQCPLRSPFSRQPRARHRVPYTRAGRLRNPQARCVDCHGRKGRKINGQDHRLPLSESQRRDGPWAQMTKTKTQEVGPRDCPVACGRWCSGLARLDTVYLIGPSILTCRHADMPTCRHADMLDKGITGLFGTASERHILMEGVRGGSPSGHMPSGQTRGASGGRRISCPGSAPPWLPCPSPSPGCRARRGAPARCPGYPPDTPWCSGRGAWRGFAGTWR